MGKIWRNRRMNWTSWYVYNLLGIKRFLWLKRTNLYFRYEYQKGWKETTPWRGWIFVIGCLFFYFTPWRDWTFDVRCSMFIFQNNPVWHKCNLWMVTLTLQKHLVQKRFARSISGHQETIARFQDLTVCSIRFRPWKWPIIPCWPNLYRFELKFYATLGFTK